MSVDSLIQIVHERGLRLHNLFEVDGRWQANVANGHNYWEFGRGSTPDEALMAALHIAANEDPEYSPPEAPPKWAGQDTKPSLRRLPTI